MMPQFTTITPTHIAGKKPETWKRFLDGGYIAIGWMHIDLSRKSDSKRAQLLEEEEYDNVQSVVDTFKRFFALRKGDYVAVNNASNGLFGVGIVTSDYRFKKHIHNSSAEDKSAWYSHYRKVEGKHTEYAKRVDLIHEGETAWQPYGTIGAICSEVPPYIKRLLGQKPPPKKRKAKTSPPKELRDLLKSIEALRRDKSHQERAHESLVEDFFTILGYEKHVDITYRQGSVDLGLRTGSQPLAIGKVKRDWDFSESHKKAAVGLAYPACSRCSSDFLELSDVII